MISAAQQQVVSSRAKRLLVRAFAGSGKTYTSLLVPKMNPEQKVLMLVFNVANAAETNAKAAAMGLSNFKASTIHSMAYEKIWPAYKDSGKEIGELQAWDLSKRYGLDTQSAGELVRAMKRFLASGDSAPGEAHLYSKTKHLAGNLQRLWQDAINPKSSVPLPMDAVLKLFQLSNVQFDANIIIADEYQDQTDCFASILEAQKARVIAVGDEHQSIYGFRNASGAMQRFRANEEVILSNCYRFGQGVALVASALLEIKKQEPNILVGRGSQQITSFDIDGTKPFGLVCRTNSAVIENCVEACQRGLSIHIIGGVEKAKPAMLVPLSNLFNGTAKSVTIRGTRQLSSWADLKEYARITDDRELLSGISLTELVRGRGQETIDMLSKRHVPFDQARVVIGTAHGWKGFEMDQVLVHDDFKCPDDCNDAQEINLLYIAVTRAKNTLGLPDNFIDWLSKNDLPLEMIDLLQKNGLNHKARHKVIEMLEQDYQISEPEAVAPRA